MASSGQIGVRAEYKRTGKIDGSNGGGGKSTTPQKYKTGGSVKPSTSKTFKKGGKC
jgi:hypothetical protein